RRERRSRKAPEDRLDLRSKIPGLDVLRAARENDGSLHRHASQIPRRKRPYSSSTRLFSPAQQAQHEAQPGKMSFRGKSGEFLGYLVTHRGIEAKPEANRCSTEHALTTEQARSPTSHRESRGLEPIHLAGDRGEQKPIFYVSQTFTDAETRYPQTEKLALAVVMSARKLRPYFQSHSIVVMAPVSLRTILHSPSQSGRLAKWAVELSEYDIEYRNKTCAKSQVLADFIIELPTENTREESPDAVWILHVDGSSSKQGSGVGIRLASPGLVANQFNGEYVARDERMEAYLALTQDLAKQFGEFELIRIPRGENTSADALAALASTSDPNLKRIIPVEFIEKPSIEDSSKDQVLTARETEEPEEMDTELLDQQTIDTTEPEYGSDAKWIGAIRSYITDGEVPAEKWAARKLKAKAARYTLIDGELFKWRFSGPLLICVEGNEARRVMEEIHGGSCGNHSGGRALAIKIKRHGYFWPTMVKDCEKFSQRCDKCQRHSPTIHQPAELLSSITSPIPSCAGPWTLSDLYTTPNRRNSSRTSSGRTSYAATGYLTRSSQIMARNSSRLGFEGFCEKWGIRLSKSTPRYPQGNGQAEAANKAILDGIKKRLDAKKGRWADELEGPRSGNKKAFAPEKENSNTQMMLDELDLIDERRDSALVRMQNYQNATARYYNSHVKQRRSTKEISYYESVSEHCRAKRWKARSKLGRTLHDREGRTSRRLRTHQHGRQSGTPDPGMQCISGSIIAKNLRYACT
ncbi:Ribonuclease H-like superfamily, partial [Arabidopsis thaliana x Arabidopsis arenosa]